MTVFTQSPVAAHHLERISALLARHDAGLRVRIVAAIVCGLMLALLPCLLLVCLIGFILWRFGVNVPWTLLMIGGTAAGIALLVLYARRAEANPFLEQLSTYDDDASSYGEYRIRQATAVYAMYWELLLLGPKMVAKALSDQAARGRIGPVDPALAARVLLRVYRFDRAVDIADLRQEVAEPRELARLLAFLHLHDWIDVGADRSRTWVGSRAKAQIQRELA